MTDDKTIIKVRISKSKHRFAKELIQVSKILLVLALMLLAVSGCQYYFCSQKDIPVSKCFKRN